MIGGTDAKLRQEMDGLARLLSTWTRTESEKPRPRGTMTQLLQRLPGPSKDLLRSRLTSISNGEALDLHYGQQWLRGRAVDGSPIMFPVATARIERDADVIRVCLRVALLFEEKSEIRALGWRFESEEVAGKPHPYPHAQSITGWAPSSKDFDLGPPERPVRALTANEKHPAFPLRGLGTPVAIGASMLATLYGSRNAREIVGRDHVLKTSFREAIDGILGTR